MGILSLVSARGSPGVTTSGLAFTLSWGSRNVLAECDPAGGTVLAGYLEARVSASVGLTPVAVAELRRNGPDNGALADELWANMVDLDAPRRERLLLPGVARPEQSSTVAPLWRVLAMAFDELAARPPGYDVIADCGRIVAPNPPWPVLTASRGVLLVLQPTLAGVAAAVPAVEILKTELTQRTSTDTQLGLLLIGHGHYTPQAVAHQLKTPVVAQLPRDAPTASVLTHGGDVRPRRALIRAAAAAERPIRRLMESGPPAAGRPASRAVRAVDRG